MNARLAALYGTPSPSGSAWQRTALDPARRKGLLTQASLLATYSHGKASRSPVPVGAFVQRQLLCRTLPEPPPDVARLEPPPHLKTTRQISVEFRQNNPSCQACHRPIDAVGLPFADLYDSLGRYSVENPSDPQSGRGQLTGTDVDGEFQGAVGLADKLAGSAPVRDCFAANLLSWSSGRVLTDPSARTAAEARAVARAAGAFAGGDIRALLLAWAASDDFVVRDGSLLPSASR